MSPKPTGVTAGAHPGTWDEDPTAASILLATGRPRHDLLVVAEPALLTELDAAWGRPASRVRLSFLPGVSAPQVPGQEDLLTSYDRGGLGVLVARGRTCLYEGKPSRRVTGLARLAAGAGVRAAVLVTRASSLGATSLGDFLAVADHLNLTGAPLFPATAPLEAVWDEDLAEDLARIGGVRGMGVVGLVPGPVRPSRSEAAIVGRLGADAVVMDSVAEAMTLAGRGVRVSGLAYVDHVVATHPGASGRRTGRRAAAAPSQDARSAHRPAPDVVRAAVETVLSTLR
ncbi:purine-nucleoside phosphorylase [Actinomyces faecalis]|uniref:phosphorylase family protein n=1 Tax=Actinomyces faecalis TaxID=2722820 RepID=UPI0015527A4B|nr:purine-nucleoside phosphorylase [Actinomyces faecalis]